MTSAARFLFPPLALAMSIANAQTIPPQTFQHIIFVIQENRSPDSLFGGVPASDAKCGVEVPFEPGVDVVNGGYGTPPGQGRQQICNVSTSMNDGVDPNHRYESGWVPQYDNGNMDGFCQIYLNKHCVQYSFIQRSDVEPYFDIATAYGFANYMFQSNEGPSFPAHLFLFSGTSAPSAPFNSDYLDFVAGNSTGFETSGCAQSTFEPLWVDPTGMTRTGGVECYPHDTLVTNSAGDKGVSWRYYTPTAGVIWTAPASIPEVCYGENDLKQQGQPCSGPEWANHVSLPNPNMPSDGAPILTDIANCDLQKISWVIPDEVWSDHPSFSSANPPYGPSWVANIVDAVGNSWSNSNHKCDYWGNNSNDTTAIFIVWDDWGGWFDHVLPPDVYRSKDSTMCPTTVQPNGWGCGNVYGFRVPLLVVSEYTKAGYVSGACAGHCPNNVFPYVHDFGSLLAFTEYNFGMPNIDQSGDNGYADLNAPDNVAPNVPLSDFFSLQDKRGFTNVAVPYPATLFENYYENHAAYRPTGPDGGDSD